MNNLKLMYVFQKCLLSFDIWDHIETIKASYASNVIKNAHYKIFSWLDKWLFVVVDELKFDSCL